MRKENILIVGANGQIGSALKEILTQKHGSQHVIASDIHTHESSSGIFELLDITDKKRLHEIVKQYHITQIYHLAAILSAKGESLPLLAWDINMKGLLNVLEVTRMTQVEKVFFPSSIAVFGSDAPKSNTPQNTPLNPETVYGISKVAGEHWCRYYHEKYGVDVRSLRYPGIIGHGKLPGGGTTDYAVEIYHYATRGEDYTAFLSEHSSLPMIYMDDALRATIEIMNAPTDQIKIRSSYNLSGMSFTPLEVARSIQQHKPDFKVSYKPDFRQAIADSWSDSIDDSAAQMDWNWKANYDLESMTADMLIQLERKLNPKKASAT